MSLGLIAAAVMLAIVLCAGTVILRLDARRRRIERQVEVAVQGSPGQRGSEPRASSIPLWTPRESNWGRFAATLIRYNPEVPFTMPTWQVALLAGLAAIGAMIVCRMALPFWIAPAAGLLAAIVVARGLFGWQRDRYAARLIRQLPDTIEVVIAAICAGLPITAAFHGVARELPNPTHEQFERVVSELNVGVPAETTLLNLFRRTGVSEYAIFSVTLAVQSKAGGRLAETLETLGTTVRQRVALAGRARALAGEAKLSAYVLGALPFIAGAGLSVLRPGFLAPLFYDQRGRTLVAFGIGSMLMGILTMRRLIKRGTSV